MSFTNPRSYASVISVQSLYILLFRFKIDLSKEFLFQCAFTDILVTHICLCQAEPIWKVTVSYVPSANRIKLSLSIVLNSLSACQISVDVFSFYSYILKCINLLQPATVLITPAHQSVLFVLINLLAQKLLPLSSYEMGLSRLWIWVFLFIWNESF